jgi:hypothetical protein
MAGSPGAITTCAVVSGSVKLIMSGKVLDPYVREHHAADNDYMTISYLDCSQFQTGLNNLTGGTPVSFQYNSSGLLSHYFLVVQTSTPVGAQLYDSVALTSFEFLKNGSIVSHQLGDNQYTASLMRSEAWQYVNNTQPMVQRGIYLGTFSDAPIEDYVHGSSHGALACTGTSGENIRLTTVANLANAQVIVYGFFHSHVKINFSAGTVEIHRKSL